MFGWFKGKQRQRDLESEAKTTIALCTDIFRQTWLDTIHHTNTSLELADEMEMFSQSAFRLMYEKFPITRQAPPFLLWQTVFTAVAEAKTHPQNIVNDAIEVLRQKYASSGGA